MTIDDALAELGVRPDTLSEEERAQLDREGYVVFPALLDADARAELNAHADEIQRGTGDELIDDDQAARIENLQLMDQIFDRLWLEPRLLACLAHCLGDFRLAYDGVTQRTALPGTPMQEMHVDAGGAVSDGFKSCIGAWMIDDFTRANGATRIVPGSHLWGSRPDEGMEDTRAHHPDEIYVEGPAGSLAFLNAHIWHSGTPNTTDAPRRGLFSTFMQRDRPEPRGRATQAQLIKDATRTQLDPAALYILDALPA